MAGRDEMEGGANNIAEGEEMERERGKEESMKTFVIDVFSLFPSRFPLLPPPPTP